jgi:SWI/SNF-related matrix-associated actin-dependent regulator 1 of chromatin subfamily A
MPAPPSNPNGTVLVPSSSPLTTAPPTTGQNHTAERNEPVPGLSFASAGHAFAQDPLSVPSGCINGNKPTDASPSVLVAGLVRPRGEDDASDAPPPKRTRPPSSDDSMDLFNIPDSPIVQKPGQRRASITTRIANMSTSLDESALDTSANSSHIVRGARPPDRSVTESTDDGPAFLPFRIIFPQFEEGKVRAAWRQAGRDVRAATVLLLDPSFVYRSTPPPSARALSPVVSPITGRIKEPALDTSANSSHIVRGARPPDQSVAESTDDGPAFLPFRISFPQFEEGKVRAAWRQAGRDVRAATALLLDSSFVYRPTPPPFARALSPVVSPITGRIKELEDARHAERAAAKEKRKKSMIYAARTNLAPRSPTPPSGRPSITAEVSIQQSPISPIVAIRHLKRPKRIAESDEEEQGKSESDEGSSRSRQRVEMTNASSDERRALTYFNDTSSEGLQELTASRFCTVSSRSCPVRTPDFVWHYSYI